MRKIKSDHKRLMIFEAGYLYCLRHNLNYSTFIDDIFLIDTFDSSEGSEFDNICKDLRFYRQMSSYKLIEITDTEYELCVDKFGEIK